MARKLRKMLGSLNDPLVTELMNLIDTQSKTTIYRWCVTFAADVVLPVYERHNPGDDRPRRALAAARDCLAGAETFAVAKKARAEECRGLGRSLEHNPAAQAAARAIIDNAFMVWQRPTHSLGLLWYAAAAVAYDQAGLDAPDEVYDRIAAEVLRDYYSRLKALARPDEPCPVKCTWACA